MKLFVTYNEIPVYFSSFEDDHGTKFCKARQRIRGKYDICPICRKDIKEGAIMLLYNNWMLFPNTVVHSACCNGFSKREDAMEYLHDDYQKALRHKHWFNLE